MKKIVECRNIYKNYYQGKIEIPVLKNINFTVEEGTDGIGKCRASSNLCEHSP